MVLGLRRRIRGKYSEFVSSSSARQFAECLAGGKGRQAALEEEAGRRTAPQVAALALLAEQAPLAELALLAVGFVGP